MIEKFADSEIRENCRTRIESLELWLRRLIDQTLSSKYGVNYFDYHFGNGDRLVKKSVVEALDARVVAEPSRYPRRIDAILLDDAIKIICHPKTYKDHFQTSIGRAFPGNNEILRGMLERLTETRNRLSHANPISLHDAYRVFAYCEDSISAIRLFYAEAGMNNEYNVPTIIRVSDSFGNSFHRDQMAPIHDGGISKNFTGDSKYYLRPGDTLTVEVEVDPSFDPTTYSIRWACIPGGLSTSIDGPKIEIPISNGMVAASWMLQCRITSTKDWHRMHLGADDFLGLWFKILPPVE